MLRTNLLKTASERSTKHGVLMATAGQSFRRLLFSFKRNVCNSANHQREWLERYQPFANNHRMSIVVVVQHSK